MTDKNELLGFPLVVSDNLKPTVIKFGTIKEIGLMKMIDRKTWQEFRETGLLWWINRILHTFGWAIVMDVEEDGSVTDVYPARVKFRGFDRSAEEEGFVRLAQYVEEVAPELRQEAEE